MNSSLDLGPSPYNPEVEVPANWISRLGDLGNVVEMFLYVESSHHLDSIIATYQLSVFVCSFSK